MSTVEAYDTRARKKVPIVPSTIRVLRKEGTNRYRVTGESRDGHRLSVFVGGDRAKRLAKGHGGIHLE